MSDLTRVPRSNNPPGATAEWERAASTLRTKLEDYFSIPAMTSGMGNAVIERGREALQSVASVEPGWMHVPKERLGTLAGAIDSAIEHRRRVAAGENALLQALGNVVEQLDQHASEVTGLAYARLLDPGWVEKKDAALAAKVEEYDRLLNTLRGALPVSMVGVQIQHFKRMRNKHAKRSREALESTSYRALALGGGAIALGIIYWLISPEGWPKVVTLLSVKAILLSLGYYWFLLALKAYRANEHLRIVYDQKQNALQTFKAFVDAGIETATKDAVLLATTNAIFTMTPTGFVDDTPDPSLAQLASIAQSLRPK